VFEKLADPQASGVTMQDLLTCFYRSPLPTGVLKKGLKKLTLPPVRCRTAAHDVLFYHFAFLLLQRTC
jgi:hypothetical protein